MQKQHHYNTKVQWTGNSGSGTQNYRAFERSHTISVTDKPDILCSSDPAFCGDDSKYNPEELLLASLSACHMLWYLHLCSVNGVNVVDYSDNATGVMVESKDGSGHFSKAELNPIVTVTNESMLTKANELHAEANKFCFIANSVNFPVLHHPKCVVG